MTHLQLGELIEYLRELIMEVLLSKLDFSHIKLSDASYFVLFVDNCGSLPLGLGQDNVNEVLKV